MPLHAIRSRSLSEQVFEQVAAEIITGRYAPGSHLPAERALTVVFDVNRHVVREALKRLEQIGLVKISQGGGTKVLDFKRHAGLDLLAIMSEHARGGDDVAAIWLAVLEMRVVIAADLARLCALRAGDDVKQDLVLLAQQMKSTSNDDELFRLDVRFWERLADGAGNIAYRLALNTMTRSVEVKGAHGHPVVGLRAQERRVPPPDRRGHRLGRRVPGRSGDPRGHARRGRELRGERRRQGSAGGGDESAGEAPAREGSADLTRREGVAEPRPSGVARDLRLDAPVGHEPEERDDGVEQVRDPGPKERQPDGRRVDEGRDLLLRPVLDGLRELRVLAR